MIPVQIDFAAAHSVEEAVRLLQAHPNSRAIAGGTDLIPALSRRQLTAGTLIDIQHIPGLEAITSTNVGGIRIGALTTLASIVNRPDLAAAYPVLAEAVAVVADPQIRNRATLGGSLLQSRPGGDLAAALLALDASIDVTGPAGMRSVSIDALLSEAKASMLEPAEIMTSIVLPGGAVGSAYEKFRDPASGFALCGVAVLIQLDGAGTVTKCRMSVTGATKSIVRLRVLEASLTGQISPAFSFGDKAKSAQIAALDLSAARPASTEYRAHLTGVLAQRAVSRALERAYRERVE